MRKKTKNISIIEKSWLKLHRAHLTFVMNWSNYAHLFYYFGIKYEIHFQTKWHSFFDNAMYGFNIKSWVFLYMVLLIVSELKNYVNYPRGALLQNNNYIRVYGVCVNYKHCYGNKHFCCGNKKHIFFINHSSMIHCSIQNLSSTNICMISCINKLQLILYKLNTGY